MIHRIFVPEVIAGKIIKRAPPRKMWFKIKNNRNQSFFEFFMGKRYRNVLYHWYMTDTTGYDFGAVSFGADLGQIYVVLFPLWS